MSKVGGRTAGRTRRISLPFYMCDALCNKRVTYKEDDTRAM